MANQNWSVRATFVAILTLGISPVLRAQTPASDPWKRVPALPTSCYRDDEFATKLDNTLQQTVTDLNTAEERNLKAKERFDAMDMAEKAQRMQAYMMRNPQEAAKMLQAQQDVSASNRETMADVAKVSARLDNELAEHKKSFDAAVERAVKPILAKQEALINAKTKLVSGGTGGVFTSAADHAQYVALINQENAEYEQACAPFFGAKGKFPAWLESYKQDVIDKQIAAEETTNAAVAVQMQIVDIPLDATTGKLRAVREYLRRLSDVTGYRRWKAEPKTPLVKP